MKIDPGKNGQKNQQILAMAIEISWLWISEKYFANVTHTSKDPPWAPLQGAAIGTSSYLISEAQENVEMQAEKWSLFPGVNFFKQYFYFIKVSDLWNVYKTRIFAKGLKSTQKKFQLIQWTRSAYRVPESYDSKFENLKSRPGSPYPAPRGYL